ncbi:unnamed protein product [Mesocestoides corti]|uniref:Uncharacterized protein n=1 Tax=Mesocestoides corti TaxID=53468 RepID=A0A0R3UK51_MESCO|nr:unnamed protein product [Mesocestoides corti]
MLEECVGEGGFVVLNRDTGQLHSTLLPPTHPPTHQLTNPRDANDLVSFIALCSRLHDHMPCSPQSDWSTLTPTQTAVHTTATSTAFHCSSAQCGRRMCELSPQRTDSQVIVDGSASRGVGIVGQSVSQSYR